MNQEEYDKELTKLAIAYNTQDYTQVNIIALALMDDYKNLSKSLKTKVKQLQQENAKLRLTLEQSAVKLQSKLDKGDTQ
ncbi:hypothetical protein N8314_00845 [Akkermansiaceae bacterium]|nr:hypothetical protein [Akkermansiaceae bacterium]